MGLFWSPSFGTNGLRQESEDLPWQPHFVQCRIEAHPTVVLRDNNLQHKNSLIVVTKIAEEEVP